MIYFLYGLFFISCLILIVSVLLQPGKTDAGALFTSSISSTAFTPRGATTVLAKMTIVAAAVFMVSALLIAMPALQGNVSVLNANPETATEQTTQPPITDVNANTATGGATDANATAPANVTANAPAAPANANK